MRRFVSFVAGLLLGLPLLAQGSGPQLYNMGFDVWSKKGGVWHLYSQEDPASKRVWDTANSGLGKLGINSVTPEYKHVAVVGEGKAACRMESRKVAWAFVSGNVYNGRFVKVVELKGVETLLGAQFSGRPKSLSGYYHYIPKKINHAEDPLKHLLGKQDEAIIEVILMDWDKQYRQVSHVDGFIDSDNDPHIIARANVVIRKGTSGYVHFDAPFEYRNGKTPRYACFTIASSRHGGQGTGASGSVLYVDEFQFNY